jgi:hypothetical protein
MSIETEMVGQLFGRLIIICRHRPQRVKGVFFQCKCKCGNTTIVRVDHLREGRVKSCGCLRKEVAAQRSKKKPYFWLYAILKRNAKHFTSKNVQLTFGEFLEFIHIKNCHYCGCSVKWYEYDICENGKRRSHSYHLDRKDNIVGYIKENCVVCCSLCNYIKGDMLTYSEMLKLGSLIGEIQRDRVV